MSPIFRLLVCNVLLAWFLTACSTPGTRARSHAAAFHRLVPSDQQLVLRGRIHPGLDKDAVYIAWGSPDVKTSGAGKSSSETWIYRQRVTIYEPMNSYDYFGPDHGFGDDPAGRGFLPARADGGVGYEGALRYQPHVRSLDSVRIAEFSDGKVDRYKAAEGIWKSARPSVTASARAPLVALTAKHTDRKFLRIVRHPDRTISVSHHTLARRTGVGGHHHPSLLPCHTPHSPPS